MTSIGRDFWDISPLFEKKPPKPKGKIKCPVCGSTEIWFKHAYVFKRARDQYRVDIIVKCGNCALVGNAECFRKGNIPFGIHISKEEYDKLIRAWGKNMITYEDTGHVNINSMV